MTVLVNGTKHVLDIEQDGLNGGGPLRTTGQANAVPAAPRQSSSSSAGQ